MKTGRLSNGQLHQTRVRKNVDIHQAWDKMKDDHNLAVPGRPQRPDNRTRKCNNKCFGHSIDDAYGLPSCYLITSVRIQKRSNVLTMFAQNDVRNPSCPRGEQSMETVKIEAKHHKAHIPAIISHMDI